MLLRLSLLFPQRRSPEEMQIICQEWLEVLPKDMSDDQFLQACKRVKSVSRFFPVPADLMQAHRDLVGQTPPQAAPLPLPCGPEAKEEMLAKNKRNISRILGMLSDSQPRKVRPYDD